MAALDADEGGVRGTAWTALGTIRGLHAYHSSYRAELAPHALLSSELASVVLSQSTDSTSLAWPEAGETPPALGLTPPVNDTKELLATLMQSLQS